MRDQPDGAALLRQARATLLEELAGELPEDRRYEVLMIASAMAIAARELAAGPHGEAERAALEGLLGPAPDDDLAAALKSLNRRLAAELRAGRRDGDALTHALLSRDAAARLALSNPKALDAEDGQAGAPGTP